MQQLKEIKVKTIGKTTITIIDKNSYKANLTKEQKDKLKVYVDKFNNNPLQFWLDKVLRTFAIKVAVSKEKIARKLAKHKAKGVTISLAEYDKLKEAQRELALIVANAAGEAVKKGADPYKAVEAVTIKAEPVAKVGHSRPGEW